MHRQFEGRVIYTPLFLTASCPSCDKNVIRTDKKDPLGNPSGLKFFEKEDYFS